MLYTPISQGHFIDHLEQGPPSAPFPARASCDTNVLRKSPATTQELLLPNILLFEFLVTHQTLKQGHAALQMPGLLPFIALLLSIDSLDGTVVKWACWNPHSLAALGISHPCSHGALADHIPHLWTGLDGRKPRRVTQKVYQSCLHFQLVCCFSELPSNYSFRLYNIGIFIWHSNMH